MSSRQAYLRETRARAIALRDEGMSTGDIARCLGVPRGTVYDWVSARDKGRDDPLILEDKPILMRATTTLDRVTVSALSGAWR